MSKINRRSFLSFVSVIIPSFLLSKAEAATSPHGTFLVKSSAIKVGQTQLYNAKDANGRTVEIILRRRKSGLTALDGTCTHEGCLVDLKRNKLVCPCHGSIFHTATGAVEMGPSGSSKNSIKPLKKYKVTERSGKIYIK